MAEGRGSIFGHLRALQLFAMLRGVDFATVQAGATLKRGDGSFNMKPAVVATIQKQPNANTLEVTERIEQTQANLKATPPPDVTIKTKAFLQADFIKRAIGNRFMGMQ